MSARQSFVSARHEQFIVRLPCGMRERIKTSAAANMRSMNSEIVMALSARFGAAEEATTGDELAGRAPVVAIETAALPGG